MIVQFLDPRLPDRFWNKVQPCPVSGCWIWTGASSPTSSGSYGSLAVGGTRRTAHSIAYETLVGLVPPGLELDHKCRTTICCNPAHLEPVTHRTNMLRGKTIAAQNASKDRCPRGHLLVEKKSNKRKGRACRECKRAGDNAAYAPSAKGRVVGCSGCRESGHNIRTCPRRVA